MDGASLARMFELLVGILADVRAIRADLGELRIELTDFRTKMRSGNDPDNCERGVERHEFPVARSTDNITPSL